MAGIRIDYAQLEAAFENHAPDVRSYLDRESGEIVVVREVGGGDEAEQVQKSPDRYPLVEPVASREQYRMMERFIETVTFEPLKRQLSDAIVGKGAFRRFKDAVGRHPDERKRWFAFRDVLLHLYILDWLKQHRLELAEMPDWTLELPEPSANPERPLSPEEPELEEAPEGDDLREYLQAWARAHGEEYRYLFGPAAFDRLAEDIGQEFTFYRRK